MILNRVATTVFVVLSLVLIVAPTALGQDTPKADPTRAFALIKQAEERIEATDYAGALEILAKAMPDAPNLARIPFMMAACEYNLGVEAGLSKPSPRAWKLLDEATRLDPDWGEPHFFGGVMSFAEEDYEGAVRGFMAALARAYSPKQSRTNLAMALFKWGVVLSGADRPEEDLSTGTRVFTDSVDRFAALKDDLRFPREERDQFSDYWILSLVNLVALYQRNEQYADAERILLALIRTQPKSHLHHHNLGLVLGGTNKNWDRALEQYRIALDLCEDPDWIDPYPMIGYILSERARTDEQEREAEEYFLKYLERRPNDVLGHTRAGDHYKNTAFRQDLERKEKRADLQQKAIRSYERSLEIDPRQLTVILKLSESLRVAKQFEEADRWKALYAALKAEKK